MKIDKFYCGFNICVKYKPLESKTRLYSYNNNRVMILVRFYLTGGRITVQLYCSRHPFIPSPKSLYSNLTLNCELLSFHFLYLARQ